MESQFVAERFRIAVDLAVEGKSSYPNAATFLAADLPDLGAILAEYAKERQPVVLVYPNDEKRILVPSASRLVTLRAAAVVLELDEQGLHAALPLRAVPAPRADGVDHVHRHDVAQVAVRRAPRGRGGGSASVCWLRLRTRAPPFRPAETVLRGSVADQAQLHEPLRASEVRRSQATSTPLAAAHATR